MKVICETYWKEKTDCKTPCMLYFSDVRIIKESMRESLKILIDNCPMIEKLGHKPKFIQGGKN